MSRRMRFFATAAKGTESLLVAELRSFGADDIRAVRAGVAFRGDLEVAYRACLWSRIATRVLVPVAELRAPDPDSLYAGIYAQPWEDHLEADATLAVDVTSRRAAITHSHFAALKTKDAIVDRFRDRVGERPSVELERPDLRVNLHLAGKGATVSLDLSGESLHRRGYRPPGAPAPLKETLAAAILLRAGWPDIARGGAPLIDPMCGSGTLPIEAALMAGDRAPGLLRRYFGFLGWKGHDAPLWQRLLAEARERAEAGQRRIPPILGSDADARAIVAARQAAANAGLERWIDFEQMPLARLQPPADSEPGLLVVNPPYGKRLGELERLQSLYAELGQVLVGRFRGWRAAVFSGNPELVERIDLQPRASHALFNGRIPCKLLEFVIEPGEAYDHDDPHGPAPLSREEWSDSAGMLANRLSKNRRELGRWARREGVDCFRLYDADLPEYALAVDLYYGESLWVHAQEYEAPAQIDPRKASRRLREALAVICEVLEIPRAQLYFKRRRRQRGTTQYERRQGRGRFHKVQEGGLWFFVNFTDYLDTGLFLDHRPTRALIRQMATGRPFLNLFAYTGAATVYAAAGGASHTTSIDMSRTYLDWADRNLRLNGFQGPAHRLVHADCRAWLREQAASETHQDYGLIFLDPPTFSTSKRAEEPFDVQRDHVEFIRLAVALLQPDGVLVFSNNYRGFKLDTEALSDLVVEDITAKTIPKDFSRKRKIHQCWTIRRLRADSSPA